MQLELAEELLARNLGWQFRFGLVFHGLVDHVEWILSLLSMAALLARRTSRRLLPRLLWSGMIFHRLKINVCWCNN